MVDAPRSDIVMMFVTKEGDTVWAESTLSVTKADPFMRGFAGIENYDEYSNFFEVTTFNFNLAVKPDDQNVGAMSQQGGPAQGGGGPPQAANDQFSRWRSAKDDEYKKIKFPIEFREFTFSRVIDGASPGFFRACCYQESFRSATLVKRVASVASGNSQSQTAGFLRIEFRDVLLTSLNWDDGDLVTESINFICKAMRIKYRRQRADSSLRDAEPDVLWEQQTGPSTGSQGGR